MKKLIGISFLLFLFFIFYKLVNQNLINVAEENSIKECNKLNYNQSLFFNSKNFRSFEAKLEIDEWRKWQIISVEDLINYEKFTQFTNRKRVDGKLFIFENKMKKCYFQISLRPHGDQKDHRDGNYLPSLQINIKEGNIFGVTNFLLLRPKQRGHSNEIFASHLLRTIGLMAPRTAMVNIEFSSGKYKFLFQEKIRKEFLEFSNKKEGPIFEGDERFVFNLGDVPFVNHRISNSNYIRKGPLFEYMSEKALSILNMYGANHTQSMHRGWVVDYSSMQNDFNRTDFKNLEIFDSIMFAIDALAGLSLQDRRFYYDAIQSKFIPIFYDGIPNLFDKRNRFINKTIKYKNLTKIDKKVIAFTYPSLFEGKISDSAVRGSTQAIELVKKIDLRNFTKDLDKFGANISPENSKKAILAIISRLEKIEKLNQDKIFDFKKFNNSLYDHYSTKNYKLQKLIFNSQDNKSYEICKIKEEACSIQDKAKLRKYKLLSQEEKFDDKDLIFISKTNNKNLRKGWFHQNNKKGYLKKFQITNDLSVLKSNNGIELEILEKEKKIYIIKNSMSGRIVFTGKILDGWDISFTDETNLEYLNNSEALQLSDENGLTGCITFYDIKLKNILIDSKNSKCEDSINFINVSGSIENIKVQNSISDGIDFDFSNLKINNLISINSKNDCIDFSYGQYLIKNVVSEYCGDKGLSVGENSNVKVNELISKYSKIGVASKDSSVTEIDQANLENIIICFSAYNKKQEFNGALLNVNNYECNNYDQKFNFDDQSIIKLNNKIMKKT
jgi:uncharacterized ubiquitin-like protein YukD